MFVMLMLLTVASFTGLQGWMTLFNNFAVEKANFDGFNMGFTQSIREIPGFLALLVVYILIFIREDRLAVLSIFILGVGIFLTGFFPSFTGIVFTTLIMSFGFHYYETVNQSLTLQYFEKSKSPLVFGRLRSIAAITSILTGIVVYFLTKYFDYKTSYMILGGFVMFIAFVTFFMDPTDKSKPVQTKRMIFSKKYWLFYLLTFLAGARRQIFTAFSVFLLVKKFEFSIQSVALLFFVNNFINFLISPLIGKAVNRFGERKVLSLEYFSLIFIFLTYALTPSKYVAAFVYILDHIFFNFSMAIKTFFQKIADERDIASSMAVGFTINHIAAVILPVLGGMLWLINYRIPFIAGAFLSFASLLAVQFIKRYESL
ncbi:MFS transporter [Deferribacteraceae bacterium V6Fe1]|nr:MFS transporter [Deferribacteraceae bacterium V6Fe1]